MDVGLVNRTAALDTSHSNDDAAIDIELFMFFAVDINSHFGARGTDGINQSAIEIAVAIGVDAIVVGGACINITVGNGHVLRRVDGIIVCVDVDFTAGNVEVILALNAFSVISGSGHLCIAAADDHSATIGVAVAALRLHTGLDAFG